MIRIAEEDGVRLLQFSNHWIQGAMRLGQPWALELDYTRDMMLPLLLRPACDWPRSVLQVGLVAGSITRFLYRHRPEAQLTVVEIDPEVVLAAWQCFDLPEESRRLRIEIGDGYRYMETARRRFDLIIVDGFDGRGRAGALDSPSFYRFCRARLSDRGLMAVNLIDRQRGAAASVARLRRAFDGRVLALPPLEVNIVAIAAVGAPVGVEMDALRASAVRLKVATRLDLRPLLDRIAGRSPGARRRGARRDVAAPLPRAHGLEI